jgi:glycosyltransferase involved in cell wall biosynthesis
MSAPRPKVSVVLSTYNREAPLRVALEALVAQRRGIPYEVLVVDNNSSDGTFGVVREFEARYPDRVRYLFEAQQGLPFARNAGILAARAPIVAFTDDDVYVVPDWIASIERGFAAYPDVDMIGGRVLPRWTQPPPPWFSQRLLAPLALQDKGEAPLRVGARNAAPCLIGANFACRREVFDRVGLFDTAYIRAEDREIQLRLWRAGCEGLYLPDIMTWVDVPAERLTKQYFRRWHVSTGEWAARMRLLDLIDRGGALVPEGAPSGPRLFGAPAYLFRQVAQHAGRWAAAALRRDEAGAFYEECRSRYLAAYVRERMRGHRRATRRPILAEMAGFIHQLTTRRRAASA